MTIDIALERGAADPLYQQIAAQLRARIRDGRLPTGARLPTVRRLALELGVTRNTVHDAYGELQSAGWVESIVGSGTYVRRRSQPRAMLRAMADDERPPTAERLLGDLLRLASLDEQAAPGVRSMAVSVPDPRLAPTEALWDAIASQRGEPGLLTGYGHPLGDPALRVALTEECGARGVTCEPDEILVTAGVTQGLSLTARVLAEPGDTVLVEQPTYLGCLHVLAALGLKPIGIPLDEEGPVPEAVEAAILEHQPRFFYTVPTFHNPSGITATVARREALAALAARHDLWLIEDDVYGRLAYDGPPPPALAAFDHAERVIYLSSVSKALAPDLRIGWVVAPKEVREQLLALRYATDLCLPTVLQRALARYLTEGGLATHLARSLPVYRRRRDALLMALRHHMPKGVRWTEPQGGLCAWLTLPPDERLRDVHRLALRYGLAVAPGAAFWVTPPEAIHLRLAFGHHDEATIWSCVELLSRLIATRMEWAGGQEPQLAGWTPLV
jgi:DNA-binding transcriptional MocR family regulator